MNRLEEGITLASSGRFDEAKGVFESSLLEDPRNPEVLYNLGMCFTELGQADKAIVVLKKSIEYNPRHSNSFVALGYAYSKMGGSDALTVYGLGYTYQELKDYQKS